MTDTTTTDWYDWNKPYWRDGPMPTPTEKDKAAAKELGEKLNLHGAAQIINHTLAEEIIATSLAAAREDCAQIVETEAHILQDHGVPYFAKMVCNRIRGQQP